MVTKPERNIFDIIFRLSQNEAANFETIKTKGNDHRRHRRRRRRRRHRHRRRHRRRCRRYRCLPLLMTVVSAK